MPYAVVDLETTGVFPRRDRVVEVAVVGLADDGSVVDEYATLVNPERDVGPTSIHGISAGQVLEAPTFAEVAGDVASRLQGRVLVAHNARFDEDFLREEFRRAQVNVGTMVRLCTLQMAYALEPDDGGRSLRDCCSRAGIEECEWHRALDDARATARLFNTYAGRAWREGCKQVSDEIAIASAFPTPAWSDAPAASGRSLSRHDATAKSTARKHYLGRLIHELTGDDAPTADEAGYLQILDRALSDRIITPEESQDLIEEARRRGLTPAHTHACHHLYVRGLANRALEDGKVTAAERKDLDLVASLLGVSADVLELMLQTVARTGLESLVGKVACFTGDFGITREEATARAEAKGVVVTDSVTKKTHVLVAADPDSASGKAEKARRYGIPVIGQQEFWTRLGIGDK